jgi:hypothetical protein
MQQDEVEIPLSLPDLSTNPHQSLRGAKSREQKAEIEFENCERARTL